MLSDKATICFSHRIGSKWVQHQNCATGWRSTRSSPRLFILWVQLYSMVFSVHQDVSLATCPRCVAECCRYWLYLIIADTDYIWLYWLNGRSFTNDPWWYPVPICFVYELMVCVSFLLQGKAQAQYEAGKAVQEQMSEILYIYNIYIYIYINYISLYTNYWNPWTESEIAKQMVPKHAQDGSKALALQWFSFFFGDLLIGVRLSLMEWNQQEAQHTMLLWPVFLWCGSHWGVHNRRLKMSEKSGWTLGRLEKLPSFTNVCYK